MDEASGCIAPKSAHSRVRTIGDNDTSITGSSNHCTPTKYRTFMAIRVEIDVASVAAFCEGLVTWTGKLIIIMSSFWTASNVAPASLCFWLPTMANVRQHQYVHAF